MIALVSPEAVHTNRLNRIKNNKHRVKSYVFYGDFEE